MTVKMEELQKAWDLYEERFEGTFSNIDMTPEETLATIKQALSTGVPFDDSIEEGSIL